MSRRVVSSYVQIKFRESAGIRLCYERVFDTIHIMKRCSKCGVEQSPDQFYKAKGLATAYEAIAKSVFRSEQEQITWPTRSERLPASSSGSKPTRIESEPRSVSGGPSQAQSLPTGLGISSGSMA
jgi:hypothetical protein